MTGRDDNTGPATEPMGRGLGSIGWQEAVTRLTAERIRAETGIALLKKYGDGVAIDRGALVYGDAKAEFDAIIAGLLVALARREEPTSLPTLEVRLQRAVASHEVFAALVRSVVPNPSGERDLITVVSGGALTLLGAAIGALWRHACEADRLTAETIKTQLEAARWPAFTAIPPAA